MRCLRMHVIPLAGAVASLSAIKGQDEFALGNDADILGIVAVWRYDSALGVGGKQDITVLRLQLEGVERPVKWWKITQQFRKMRHVFFFRSPSIKVLPRVRPVEQADAHRTQVARFKVPCVDAHVIDLAWLYRLPV